ncbi:vomeronasal type-1 receptor 4-like [Equus asinus]|uniref:vomeronasal type-1 receptor 4-like n=1 Tax=Equus asinus TaxID=9793 RepID=UPI0038F6D945
MYLLAQRNDCSYNLKENVLNDRIESSNMTIGIIGLSQTVMGILGNFCLLYHYLLHGHTKGRLRATDLILKHLTISNSLIILSEGVPQTVVAFGLKHFFNYFWCKLLMYVQRVGRSVSICMTCLLRVFQTIMISPMNSCWKDLKLKAPKYIGFSVSLCWILYMVVNVIVPMYELYMFGKGSVENIVKKRYFEYCSANEQKKINGLIYVALIVFPEVSFTMIIIWTSGSMVFILYRHKQHVQHIHKNNTSHRSSPESRATLSILILVSSFLSFQTLSSTFHLCIALTDHPNWWLVNATHLISVCFPTVSPFLLMSSDSTLSRLCFAWIRNTKFPNLITKI